MKKKSFTDKYVPQFECDAFLETSCLELIIILIDRWRNNYQERLIDCIFNVVGEESSAKIVHQVMIKISTIKLGDPRYTKFERLNTEFSDVVDFKDMSRWSRKLNAIDRKLFANMIDSIRNILVARVEKNKEHSMKSFFYERLMKIVKTFDLNESEKKVIVLLCLFESNTQIYDLLHTDWNPKDFEKSKEVYRAYLQTSEMETRKTISKTGKLSNIGIISFSERNYRDFDVDMSIFHYLNGLDERPLTDKFYTHVDLINNVVIDIKDHSFDDEQTELLLKLIQRDGGTNIIFHGAPGVGKTEFAKSIAKKLQLNLYFINNGQDADDDKSTSVRFRRIAVQAATKILDIENSLIIVDEADTMLNLEDSLFQSVSHSDKSWLNTFLENSKSKIIWISNQGQRIESSTRRRFNMAIEFKDLTKEKRLHIWKNQCQILDVKFLQHSELEKLASDYQVNAGPIAMALGDLKKLHDSNLLDRSKIFKSLEKLLEGHRKFLGKNMVPSSAAQSSDYFPDYLNTSIAPEKIMESLKHFTGMKMNGTLPKGCLSYNILFYGASGTGKTQYARHIASELGLNLVTKKVSDLFSKWLGESENNIAQAFKEAEENGVILFLDECDSFFYDRSSALTSHEITRTNELLVAMENFNGILICSTNLKDGLDGALSRRFVQKVKFDYVVKEKISSFYTSFFQRELPERLFEKLQKLSCLSLGDFGVVKKRMLFEGIKSDDEIIDMLGEEVIHKKEMKSKIKI